MVFKKLLFVVSVMIYLSFCWCYTCPDDSDVVSLDLSKFSGEWFMVAGTPITSKLGSCLHFQVDSNSDRFLMNFTTTSYRNNRRLLWKVYGNQRDDHLLATWQLSFSKNILGPFRHQILSIDYDNYCAMVVCAEDRSVIPKQMFAMIWSRTKTLPDKNLSKLKEIISSYVDEDDILDVDNECNGISF